MERVPTIARLDLVQVAFQGWEAEPRRWATRLLLALGTAGRLTAPLPSSTLPIMQALPPSCPPLPNLPPLFWTEVAKQVAHWQEFFAHAAPGDADPDEMRKICVARIKTRLKRVYAGKNAGRSLFEMAHFVACLRVIESRN